MIILEDYWSPGQIIDTYYDVLSKKDIEYIENLPTQVGQAVLILWVIQMRGQDLWMEL